MFREERSSTTRSGLTQFLRQKVELDSIVSSARRGPIDNDFYPAGGGKSREDRSAPELENFEFDARKYLVTQMSGFLKTLRTRIQRFWGELSH